MSFTEWRTFSSDPNVFKEISSNVAVIIGNSGSQNSIGVHASRDRNIFLYNDLYITRLCWHPSVASFTNMV